MMKPAQAQVLIEYLTMAILIMFAILLMGPYTIRSINAFFRFSEDTMKDSSTEKFNQEALVPNEIPAGCICQGWHPQHCAEGGCKIYEMLETRQCTTHCDIEKRCLPDNTCCEIENQGCWWIPGIITCPTAGNNYNYEQRVIHQRCGGATAWDAPVCSGDPDCAPRCLPTSTPPAHSTFCLNTLSETQPYTATTVISSASNCATQVGRCIAKCDPGFAPDAGVPPTTCN